MTAIELRQKYKQETGVSCMNTNNEAGSDFYTDDYIQWLENYIISKTKEGMPKIVLYNEKNTIILKYNEDATCIIINPDYDYDLEKECHINNIEYGIPYCITVSLLDLTPIK